MYVCKCIVKIWKDTRHTEDIYMWDTGYGRCVKEGFQTYSIYFFKICQMHMQYFLYFNNWKQMKGHFKIWWGQGLVLIINYFCYLYFLFLCHSVLRKKIYNSIIINYHLTGFVVHFQYSQSFRHPDHGFRHPDLERGSLEK